MYILFLHCMILESSRSLDFVHVKVDCLLLNLCILVKLDDLDRALSSFDKSMTLATSLEDEAAQNAISKAVNDLKSQIDSGKFYLKIVKKYST